MAVVAARADRCHVGPLRVGVGVRGGCRRGQGRADLRQPPHAAGVGQKSVMADPLKARRQDVFEHSGDQLGFAQFHHPVPVSRLAIRVAEPHRAVRDAFDARITERDAVGVAAQVVDDGRGSGQDQCR